MPTPSPYPFIIALSTAIFLLILIILPTIPNNPPTIPGQNHSSQQTTAPTSPPTTNSNQPTYATVARIVDGDTIELDTGQKVRYIGIDTPEVGECYYQQATQKNSELVLGKQVRLEKDISETDRYGRLLRYIYIQDQFINNTLVSQGFAQASSYPPDIKHQDLLRSSQQSAQSQSLGLWGTDCQKPVPTSSSNQSTCQYNCSGPDKDCSDFTSQAEAQTFFTCCGFTATNDPMRLDNAKGQGNGQACESLP